MNQTLPSPARKFPGKLIEKFNCFPGHKLTKNKVKKLIIEMKKKLKIVKLHQASSNWHWCLYRRLLWTFYHCEHILPSRSPVLTCFLMIGPSSCMLIHHLQVYCMTLHQGFLDSSCWTYMLVGFHLENQSSIQIEII